MQVEIIEQYVDRQLVDVGIKSDFEEQAVRLLLFHLCIAIDIYRHMTQAEKNKSGYWYREKLKNSFSITGFLKERKRKRDKKKSPLHPSYKEESGVKEKSEIRETYKRGAALSLEERKQKFHDYCHKFDTKYGVDMVDDFYVHWSEEDADGQMMKFELEETWNTAKRLYKWWKDPITNTKKLVKMKLKNAGKKAPAGRVPGGGTAEMQTIAAEREAADAQREAATAKAKADSITMEEYLKNNPDSILRTLKKND